MKNTAVLRISCPYRKGTGTAISDFLCEYGANIIDWDEHLDNALDLLLLRVEWSLEDFVLNEACFRRKFGTFALRFSLSWEVEYCTKTPAVAVFVSHHLHCLLDLLHRYQTGELDCDIGLIISNHQSATLLAEYYSVPFYYLPVTPQIRAQVEAEELELLARHSVDLIVLARYLQVISAGFVAKYPLKIINVRQSFLSGFPAVEPYHEAFTHGVKLLGSTGHYVTPSVDEGPIIEQEVTRITYSDQLDDVIQKGRDLERIVLSRAVRWHLDHRILCYANKAVVFA
ncbi:MAG: formyltetrahydrofolate deformylase [Verrucomicrobia bacterium]|nr:formyltetrahydrofolate deformylase [Verrucomicrobiota bacterium]MBV8481984.1 formyltetrahydrofolate deformylase [Verrucomicrobiota bacterium]